jgi:aryl-alcohol dehydrogenase
MSGKPMAISAAVVRAKASGFHLEEASLAPPRPDEVVVRVVAVGMCHTDIATHNGEMLTPLPVVLGHEGAGFVVEIGSAVTRFAVDDPVVMSYLSCGVCRECDMGTPASCVQLLPLCFSGARPDGSHAISDRSGRPLNDRFFGQSSFATYAIANERNLVKVRRDAPLKLLGPLGCGILTGAGTVWNELKVSPGSSCAVFGAGAVGLSAVMAARIAGASTIIAVDKVDARLELARDLGATHVFNSSETDLVAAIQAAGNGGAEFALDTTGQPAVIRTAVRALRQRGIAALVAGATPELSFDTLDLLAGCKSVRGVIEGGGSARVMIPRMIDLYMQGRFPIDRLVRYYRPEQINDAVRDSLAGGVIKPIICFEPLGPIEHL